MMSVRDLYDWAWIGIGAGAHALTGSTPRAGYQGMVRQFCMTNGRSNDLLTNWIAKRHPPFNLPEPNGVLGSLGSSMDTVTQALNAKGYFVFPKKLDKDMCDRLQAFGLNEPSIVREDERPLADGGARRPYGPDRGHPRGIRYDVPIKALLENDDVQTLLCDPSILGVAQSYLGSQPFADVLSMWWHTAYSDQPSEAAAQYFHFDMDRIKWLKFFIYLTDVGPENGPHSFVSGSHRTSGIPTDLIRKGYVRLTDEDVQAHYSKDSVIEFTGERGTILAEDTRGLHKGKHVASGDRLVLQLQFSNSLFGGYYPPVRRPVFSAPSNQAFVERYPAIFSAFRPRS